MKFIRTLFHFFHAITAIIIASDSSKIIRKSKWYQQNYKADTPTKVTFDFNHTKIENALNYDRKILQTPLQLNHEKETSDYLKKYSETPEGY